METEIDLKKILSRIIDEKRLLYWFIGVALILGAVIHFTTPKEWKSEVVVFVEQESLGSLGGSLGNLASIAGINVSGALAGESLNPLSYEDIVEDKGFLYGFLDSTYYFSRSKSEFQLKEYFLNYKRYSILGRLVKAKDDLMRLITSPDEVTLEGSSLSIYSEEELDIITELQGRISFTFDIEKQLAKMVVKMQDPVVSAQIADDLYKKLDLYLQEYLVQDEKRNYRFLLTQAEKSKLSLDSIKRIYAKHVDTNKNIQSESVRIELEHIRSEYNLAFEIYSTMVRQVEEAKIRLDKEIVSLKKVGPIAVPDEKSSPSIIVSFALPVFLSIFIYLLFIFKLRQLLSDLFERS